MVPHGTVSRYNYHGCRCPACARAKNEANASNRARRIVFGREHPDLLTHGTAYTYRDYGCRCSECTEAHKTACREYRMFGSSR